jgi:hypothetical protein
MVHDVGPLDAEMVHDAWLCPEHRISITIDIKYQFSNRLQNWCAVLNTKLIKTYGFKTQKMM